MKFNLLYIVLVFLMVVFFCGGVVIIEWFWLISKDLNSLNVSYIV